MKKCPFKIGDTVKFTPSPRTLGHYQDIGRFGIKVNQTAKIKEIRKGIYLYFEGGHGGFPWNEFSPVREPTSQQMK